MTMPTMPPVIEKNDLDFRLSRQVVVIVGVFPGHPSPLFRTAFPVEPDRRAEFPK
ncbi:hypothetical protein ACGF07_29120 [Kitasatospora sp. NPDC048194]|uniref:hypothetical protein n=1 Tax=Kitasatospora sp. NPDC048194 TaxID=3364045 RepID=UPI003722028B